MEDQFIDREYLFLGQNHGCHAVDRTTGESFCNRVEEKMKIHEGLTYCSLHIDNADSQNRNVENLTFSQPKFRCPAKNCDNALSFKMFFTNTCCSVAFRMFALRPINEQLKPAEQTLKNAEKETDKYKKKWQNAENRRKRAQEDVLSLRTAKTRIIDRTLERPKCRVCLQDFNDILNQKYILTKCGHTACKRCLDRLIQKTCPGCQKPFTANSLVRIYED